MSSEPQRVRLRGLIWLRQRLDPLVRGPVRTLARAIYRWLGARRAITLQVAGAPVRFELGTEPTITNSSVTQEVAYFISRIARGDTVADVGAFTGTFTMLAAACTGPHGAVVAFEPSAESRVILERNIVLNGYGQRVQVVAAAAGDTAGDITFFTRGAEQINTVYTSVAPEGGRAITVPMVRLDDFFSDRRVQVIKIDVEGAEYSVLRGAERLLRSPAIILCEIHPYAWAQANHSGMDLVQWLRERGRRMVWLGTNEDVTTFRYGNTELASTR